MTVNSEEERRAFCYLEATKQHTSRRGLVLGRYNDVRRISFVNSIGGIRMGPLTTQIPKDVPKSGGVNDILGYTWSGA